MFVGFCAILYGARGVDTVDYAGGDDVDFEYIGLDGGKKICGVANYFVGGGGDATNQPDVFDEFGVAVVVCEFYGHYVGGAEIGAIFLWRKEAKICGKHGADDALGDVANIADYVISFWGGVADLGVAEYANFADVGLCDGSGISGVEIAMGLLATKMLDFHIGVVEFFGKMKSFLVEIETEQMWVYALYLIVLVPLVMGWAWQRHQKRKEVSMV